MSSLEENVRRIAAYYRAQAPEYHEGTYGSEKTDAAYSPLKAIYWDKFAGHSVLEIACGTGYWTNVLARTAKSVLATDVNPELVEATRQSVKSLSNTRCQVANAYDLGAVDGKFTAAIAHYWWSHIPKKMYCTFLNALHGKMKPGAFVLFADDSDYYSEYVTRRTDEHGDQYEERILRDGSRFETIKNFPQKDELFSLLAGQADELDYVEHELAPDSQYPGRVWTFSYRLRS